MAKPENPMTRTEQYLDRIAGGNNVIPEHPITRLEMYLDYIANNGGGGGGGGGDITVDPVPTQGSANPVSSGGVYDAISGISEEVTNLQDDLDQLSDSGTVPNAEQLLTDVCTTDGEPYTLRATTGKSDRAYEDAIVGGTVVMNQLIKNGNFVDASNWNSITGSKFSTVTISDEVLTLTIVTQNGSNGITQNSVIPSLANHKLLFSLKANPSAGCKIRIGSSTSGGGKYGDSGLTMTPNTWNQISKVLTVSDDNTTTNINIYMDINSALATGDAVQIKTVNVIDLTQMFGSTIADYIYSLEQATAGAGVAWFRKYFPADYYPYNAGELVSVGGVSEKDVVGFNLWDEEWELGSIDNDTGAPTSSTSRIRTKNPIHVIGGRTYYIKAPNTIGIRCYDSNYNYIVSGYSKTISNALVDMPTNAKYLRFTVVGHTTYNHDICINLSDPTRNGIYEPYTKRTYPLDSTLTLRGIPKLVDGKLSYDGDEYRPDGTVKRRYGVATFNGSEVKSNGDTAWTKSTQATNAYWIQMQMAGFPKPLANSEYINTGGFLYTNDQATYRNVYGTCLNDGTIAFSIDPAIGGSTVEEFVNYLTQHPITIVYPIDTTAQTTETAEPYQATQMVYPGGTEEYVTTSIVPVGHSTRYPDNLRKKIEGLPWDFSSIIAPTEATATASRNYTTGSLLIMNNVLYKVTANIASGSAITPNSNVTATTLSEVISALS